MKVEILRMATDIVTAYVSNNKADVKDVLRLTSQLVNSMGAAAAAKALPANADHKAAAVDPKDSVHHDYIICLEDGRKLKMLKRHLSEKYGMTPSEYRRKWGLAEDYPMTAPGYSAKRKEVARQIGLGTRFTRPKKRR